MAMCQKHVQCERMINIWRKLRQNGRSKVLSNYTYSLLVVAQSIYLYFCIYRALQFISLFESFSDCIGIVANKYISKEYTTL